MPTSASVKLHIEKLPTTTMVALMIGAKLRKENVRNAKKDLNSDAFGSIF